MNEKRLRITIIVLLVSVAVASFGCGGGSAANSTISGDFISAVIPGAGSTRGDGGNAPGSPPVSTPAGGGNAPAGSTQNTQTAQQNTQTAQTPVPEYHQLVDFQGENLPLPWEHGLGEDEIVLLPGQSEDYGNMVITCRSNNYPCFIFARIDGSVIYQFEDEGTPIFKDGNGPIFTPIPPEGFPAIPLPLATEAAQAPVLEFDFGTTLHVGSNVDPRDHSLTTGVDRNGVSVSYGTVQDGIGADKVLGFMNQHVGLQDKIAHTGVGGAPGLETFSEPPTIRLAEGTSDLYARHTAHAVQLINSALPYEKRITLGTKTLPTDTQFGDIPAGEIFLKFGSLERKILGAARLLSNYLVNSETNEQEEAQSALKASVVINEEAMRFAFEYNPEKDREDIAEKWDTKILDSRVENTDSIIKWYNDEIFNSVIVHELLHALGFYHTDKNRFSESVMNSVKITGGQENVYTPYLDALTFNIFVYVNETDSSEETTDEHVANARVAQPPIQRKNTGYLATPGALTIPGHILFPLDRAALLAAYGKLDPGAQPDELTAENLGDWSDTSFHLRGDMDIPGGGASFGVASGNGLAQPWASGPTPWTNLADNNDLSRSAAWNGALLGVTSSSETVAGAARLSVNLASLSGRIDFTGMEKWGVKEAPGAVGSGAMWGDGDLGYAIEVRGNTFIQTAGDDGKVTGAFFGAAHEAMGGVLERADLAAGFGGKR